MSIPPIQVDSFWLPKASSTLAPDVDLAWNAVLWLSIVMFIGVVGTMFYFMYRYKRRKEGEKTSEIDHNTALEVSWMVIPFILLMGLFGIGLKGYLNAHVAPAEALEVKVTAAKWLWTFTYPNGTVTVNELAVPKGKPVHLVMSSQDVLHSFWVPEFRIKQDVVPGMYTTTWFQADEARDFTIECTEYCGKGHSEMLGAVMVMEPAAFEDWLDKGGSKEDLPPVELGQKLFTTRTCNTCHSLDGTRIQGPTFKGIFGRKEILADGSEVTVDENYIRESLLNPGAKIVKGYPPVMPTFQGMLKDKDIDALIAYLKTLK